MKYEIEKKWWGVKIVCVTVELIDGIAENDLVDNYNEYGLLKNKKEIKT